VTRHEPLSHAGNEMLFFCVPRRIIQLHMPNTNIKR